MSYESINAAVHDQGLIDRVIAAASKEAWANVDYAATEYGERLRTYPDEAQTTFMYAVAIDYELQYAYAYEQGKPDAGTDRGVISDENLQAAVQAHWPASTTVPLPTDMVGPTPGTP